MTILMCAQKLTDASLIYRTEPKTKTRKKEKIKNKNGYAQKKQCRARKPWSQSGRGKEVYGGNDLWNRKVLSLE